MPHPTHLLGRKIIPIRVNKEHTPPLVVLETGRAARRVLGSWTDGAAGVWRADEEPPEREHGVRAACWLAMPSAGKKKLQQGGCPQLESKPRPGRRGFEGIP